MEFNNKPCQAKITTQLERNSRATFMKENCFSQAENFLAVNMHSSQIYSTAVLYDIILVVGYNYNLI